MPDRAVNVEVDFTSDAAYVLVQDAPVASTVALTDEVNVDLDEYGVVVGVEILTLVSEWPMDAVAAAFHLPQDVADLVAAITNPVLGVATGHVMSAGPAAFSQPNNSLVLVA